MAAVKVIAVIGALGAQGGALVEAILADASGQYKVRAITRKTTSDKAVALAARGVDVVSADLEDVASLQAAFAGAHGVFAITNFWEHFSGEKEFQQASNIAQAAKAAGVQHVVWSTLEDTRVRIPLGDPRMTVMQGAHVPHFDYKGAANAAFVAAGVPTTNLHTSFYLENFLGFMKLNKGADGSLSLVLPGYGAGKLPVVAVADIGKAAFSVFKDASLIGKDVGIASDQVTGAELAALFSEALGRPVAYHIVPIEVARTFQFPGAEDIANMFHYKALCADTFNGLRSLESSRALVPDLTSARAWFTANASKIPIPE